MVKAMRKRWGQIFTYGLEVGRQLKSLGINCNFAPVADIFSGKVAHIYR